MEIDDPFIRIIRQSIVAQTKNTNFETELRVWLGEQLTPTEYATTVDTPFTLLLEMYREAYVQWRVSEFVRILNESDVKIETVQQLALKKAAAQARKLAALPPKK
jgi:hypothetical protein